MFVAKVIALKSRHSTPSRMLKQWARLIEPEIDRAVFVDRGPSERVPEPLRYSVLSEILAAETG